MKRYCIIFLATCHSILIADTTQTNATSNKSAISSQKTNDPTATNPADLKADPPKNMPGVATYASQRARQVDYFFTHLPQAELPDSLVTEIHRVFTPLLSLLSPIDAQQTQEERQAEVMNRILRFYGLLYLIAQEEALAHEQVTPGSGKATTVSTAAGSEQAPSSAPTLTAAQLKQSGVWQDHLKIMAASSYQQELSLLGKIHEHELAMFDYLPQFETAYYQSTFVQVRKSSELTRMYLILVDRLRKRFLQDINRPANDTNDSWGTILETLDQTEQQMLKADQKQRATLQKTLLQQKNQLFQEISAFLKSPFYIITMQFENIDWSQTSPVAFVDLQGNPTTFQDILKNNYNFDQYFSYDPKANSVEINPLFSLMLELAPAKDGSNKQELLFTALGNLIFSGNISYSTVPTKDGKTVHVGTFEPQKQSTDDSSPRITLDTFFTTQKQDITVSKQTVQKDTMVPTLGYMELLCFTAMKLLYNDTAELFKSGNLQPTFEKMVTTELPNFIAQQPEDYLLLQEIDAIQDFFASQGVKSDDGGALVTQGCGAIGHFFKKIGDALVKVATDAWHGIEGAAKAAFKAVEDAGKAFWHGIKAIGDEVVSLYYATCILPMVFQGMSASDALKHAAEYQKKANEQMDAATKDLVSSVNDIATSAEDLAHAAGAIAASALAGSLQFIDPKITQDMEGVWDSVADGVIKYMKDSADMTINLTGSAIKLTAEANQLIVDSVGAVVSGGAFSGEGIKALGSEFVSIAKNTAAAVVGYLTMAIKQFEDALKSAMQCVGYLTQALTDAVIDLMAAVATLAYYGWADGWSSGFDAIKGKLDQHQRLISSIISTTLLIAVTVATGGAATPFAAGMLAMNVGMMAMNIVGAAQADQAAIDKKEQQERFVAHYKQYVIENATVIENFNTSKAIEELVQLQSETMNKERALLYYQNYLNSIFNGTLSTQAYSTGVFINQQTALRTTTQNQGKGIADVTGVMQADLGSLYGIQTGRMNLSTSGGFALYNKGRGTFSQEAAVPSPIVPGQSETNVLDQKGPIKTFWFHQKDLANIPAGKPLKADVLWRSIYEYDGSFYIGVYLTERSLDTQAVNKLYGEFSTVINPKSGITSSESFDPVWEKIDTLSRYLLDYDNLAKMFVCYRKESDQKTDQPQNSPQLGVYVHEAPSNFPTANTDGWLKTQFAPINFKRGTWYRMQATLKDKNLELAFWEVGSDEKAQASTATDTPPQNALSQSITVDQAVVPQDVSQLLPNKKFAGSMGVITSGAAVEYRVLEPSSVVVVQTQGNNQQLVTLASPQESSLRVASNKQLAQTPGMDQSEGARQKTWYQQLEQKLAPQFGNFSLTAISRPAIMQSEFIYKTKGTFSKTDFDYLVFSTTSSSPGPNQIGVSPASKKQPSALLSLISGQLYDNKGTIVGRIDNPVNLYERGHPKLTGQLKTDVQASRKAFLTTLVGPFSFKNLTLKGEIDAMTNGAFVYSGPSLNEANKGQNDYYVFGAFNAVGISQSGLPLILGGSSSIGALISLVSAEVYYVQLNGATPSEINSENIGTIEISDAQSTNDLYEQYKPKLSSSLQATLEKARTAFKAQKAALTEEKQAEQAAQDAINLLNTALTSIDNELPFASGGETTALNNAKTAGAQAATALQTAIKSFKNAMQQGKASKGSPAYSSLQSAITAAKTATTNANNAVTKAQNAALAGGGSGSSGDDYGYSSDSDYGSSSSYQNYNTTYGGYGSGYDDYGSDSYGY